jgi:hypothetical protein
MKREFLEGLGLNKEQTDAIMSEYGKSLEALKLRNAELEGICADYNELVVKKEMMKNELEEEKLNYAALKKSMICELVDGARPSSSLAREELIRRLEGCPSDKIYATLNELRASDPSAFSYESDHPVFSSFSHSEDSVSPINFVRRR